MVEGMIGKLKMKVGACPAGNAPHIANLTSSCHALAKISDNRFFYFAMMMLPVSTIPDFNFIYFLVSKTKTFEK